MESESSESAGEESSKLEDTSVVSDDHAASDAPVSDDSDSVSSAGPNFASGLTDKSETVSLVGTIDWSELTYLLEQILSFHAWYKRGAPFDWDWSISNEANRQSVHQKIVRMMQMFVKVLPRQTGNGWCIQKFHELLHISHAMVQFGSPTNWDAGPGESSLKTFAKKRRKLPKREDKTFSWIKWLCEFRRLEL